MKADRAQALIDCLQGPVAEEWGAAADGLAQFRDPRALPALYLALRRSRAPREPIVRALFRTVLALDFLEPDFLWRCVAHGLEAIDVCFPHQTSGGRSSFSTQQVMEGLIRLSAAKAGDELGRSPRPDNILTRPLFGTSFRSYPEEIESAQELVRLEPAVVPLVIWAMRRMGGADVLPALRAALADRIAGARRMAAEALGELRDEDAVAPLCRALKDPDLFVRRAAAAALEQIPEGSAVDPLCGALDDGDPPVQVIAARTLAAIGDPRALAPLRAKLGPFMFVNGEVRKACRAAVVRIEEQAGGSLPRPSDRPSISSAELPRPSEPRAASLADLPRPAAAEGEIEGRRDRGPQYTPGGPDSTPPGGAA